MYITSLSIRTLRQTGISFIVITNKKISFIYLFTFIFLKRIGCPPQRGIQNSSGTGSQPPLEKGLQRKTLHAASTLPFAAPNFSIASSP